MERNSSAGNSWNYYLHKLILIRQYLRRYFSCIVNLSKIWNDDECMDICVYNCNSQYSEVITVKWKKGKEKKNDINNGFNWNCNENLENEITVKVTKKKKREKEKKKNSKH